MIASRTKITVTTLEVIAFVVGTAILTFELTAARLVAPYIGSTVYTWTSIIGVILGALAYGYYKGGIWADTRQLRSDIILLLLAAGAGIVAVSLLKDPVLALVAAVSAPLQLKAFIASVLLFAVPTFLLGAILPYLARLSIVSVATSGRHLSRIDAASTVGSLTGTFLTGYVLFGLVGSSNILSLIAVSLLAASLLISPRKFLYWRAGLLLLIVFAGFIAPKPFVSGLVDDIDTAYSRVIIRDIISGGRTARVLQTDHEAYQSGIYLDGMGGQPFAYIRAFSYASELAPAGRNYLIIGGGAFTFPEYLAKKFPEARVDTVEIDSQLPGISKRYFNFRQPQNLRVIHQDGRAYLNQNKTVYDIIYLDAFSALVPPFQLMTAETANRMHGSLNNSGVLAVNVISAAAGPDSDMIKHAYSTYKSVFNSVEVYAVQPVDATANQNLLLFASKKPLPPSKLADIAATSPDFADMLGRKVPVADSSRLIMTDDYAPVERLAL